MEKLTYYQICNLIYQGKENEIPSGYELKWINSKPQKPFNIEIPGRRIIVNGNDFPSSTKAYVSGEYRVSIPMDIMSKTTLLDFGIISLRTEFSLSELKFEYEHLYDILSWVNRRYPYNDAIKKSECMFNAILMIKDTPLTIINVFNALPIILKDNIADITYDWAELRID